MYIGNNFSLYFTTPLILCRTLRIHEEFFFNFNLLHSCLFFWENLTVFSVQDCGPSLGLAAGIPSLVATALLVALLFTLIHRRRSSSESTEVTGSFFGSGHVGGHQYSMNWLWAGGVKTHVWFLRTKGWDRLIFCLRLMTLPPRQSWFIIQSSGHLRTVLGVVQVGAERDVCCHGEHVCAVSVFSNLEKQGHRLLKEDGGEFTKDGRQLLRCPSQGYVQEHVTLFIFVLFLHPNTHQSHGNLLTPPLTNTRVFWRPGSEFKGHSDPYPTRDHGCDTTVLCGLCFNCVLIYEHFWSFSHW